jgi:hypothetical protein
VAVCKWWSEGVKRKRSTCGKRPSVSESNMSVSAEKDLQVGEDERRQEVSRRPLC